MCDDPPPEKTTQKPDRQPGTIQSRFDQFWAAYPRKTGKRKALGVWTRLNPPLEQCLSTLAVQIKSEQWQKDGGQFIPHTATWLGQGRWEDVAEDPFKRPAPLDNTPVSQEAYEAALLKWPVS